MSELLIIKAGAEYLRFSTDEFALGALNKASVFPMLQAEEAKERCRKLAAAGVAVMLMKLTILEEPYTE
jgi:hypothetical protein